MSITRGSASFKYLGSVDLFSILKKIITDVADAHENGKQGIALSTEASEIIDSEISTAVTKLADKCMEQFKTQVADDKQIDGSLLGAPALIPIFGDTFFLKEPLKNTFDEVDFPLLDQNDTPIHYSDEQISKVTFSVFVKLDPAKDSAVLVMQDDGPGFPKGMLGNYLDFYKSSKKESTKAGKTGGQFEGLKTMAEFMANTLGQMMTVNQQYLQEAFTPEELGDLADTSDKPGARIVLSSRLYSPKLLEDMSAKLGARFPSYYLQQLRHNKLEAPDELQRQKSFGLIASFDEKLGWTRVSGLIASPSEMSDPPVFTPSGGSISFSGRLGIVPLSASPEEDSDEDQSARFDGPMLTSSSGTLEIGILNDVKGIAGSASQPKELIVSPGHFVEDVASPPIVPVVSSLVQEGVLNKPDALVVSPVTLPQEDVLSKLVVTSQPSAQQPSALQKMSFWTKLKGKLGQLAVPDAPHSSQIPRRTFSRGDG